MALHNELGKEGEELAANWLSAHGYTILHRNWRYSRLEIDIVATKGKFLHFIEVKTRYYTPFGHPEESVTKKKFKKLQWAANEYLFLYPGHLWIQYDIVAVTMFGNGRVDYFLIEDVFL